MIPPPPAPPLPPVPPPAPPPNEIWGPTTTATVLSQSITITFEGANLQDGDSALFVAAGEGSSCDDTPASTVGDVNGR